MSLKNVFDNTQCESTSCGVLHLAALSCGGSPLGDASIRTARDAWLANRTVAEATYGHISTWATGGVTEGIGGAALPRQKKFLFRHLRSGREGGC